LTTWEGNFTWLNLQPFIPNLKNEVLVTVYLNNGYDNGVGLILLTYKTRPARENGMGNMFIGKCSTSALVLASLFTALSAIAIEYLIGFNTYIFIYLYLIGSMVLIFILSRLLISLSYRRIDGITGDLLGCVIEISEVVFLIYILIVMR